MKTENLKKMRMDNLYVHVDIDKLQVRLIKMRYCGRHFYKGSRYFIASNGFIISSDTPCTRVHPRIGRLCLPKDYTYMDNKLITLEDCPYNRTFLKFMKEAIEEYNKETK